MVLQGQGHYCNNGPTKVTDPKLIRAIAGIKRRGVPYEDPDFNLNVHSPSVANALRQYGPSGWSWSRPSEWRESEETQNSPNGEETAPVSSREMLFGADGDIYYDQVFITEAL